MASLAFMVSMMALSSSSFLPMASVRFTFLYLSNSS